MPFNYVSFVYQISVGLYIHFLFFRFVCQLIVLKGFLDPRISSGMGAWGPKHALCLGHVNVLVWHHKSGNSDPHININKGLKIPHARLIS